MCDGGTRVWPCVHGWLGLTGGTALPKWLGDKSGNHNFVIFLKKGVKTKKNYEKFAF